MKRWSKPVSTGCFLTAFDSWTSMLSNSSTEACGMENPQSVRRRRMRFRAFPSVWRFVGNETIASQLSLVLSPCPVVAS